MSLSSIGLSILIVIISIPIFAYAIGLIVPASHIVSIKTAPLKTSSEKLWKILTDVSKYPEWQPKIKYITVDEIDIQENKLVFVEYSTSKRHTLVVHHEQIPGQCLLRILEDTPNILNKKYGFKKKRPTFSGSWTFEILETKDQDQVCLKITEQGIIKNPFVRLTHLLVSGHYGRMERFARDLNTLINKDIHSNNSFTTHKILNLSLSTVLEEEVEEINNVMNEMIELPDDISSDQLTQEEDGDNDDGDYIMNSKFIDKEWDLVSEIYERTAIKAL